VAHHERADDAAAAAAADMDAAAADDDDAVGSCGAISRRGGSAVDTQGQALVRTTRPIYNSTAQAYYLNPIRFTVERERLTMPPKAGSHHLASLLSLFFAQPDPFHSSPPLHFLTRFKAAPVKAATAKAKAAAANVKKGVVRAKAKIRTSVHFHRPSTLKAPRAPKYQRRAVPTKDARLNHHSVIK
jgi:hypothetical protein